MVGSPDAQPSDDQVSVPSDFTQGPTVWVGESDTIVTFPAGYDGGTVVTEIGPRTEPEKVVLILDAEITPLIGSITFGDVGPPPPATDPNQPYPPSPTMIRYPNGQVLPLLPDNWAQSPFPGFSYSLVSSTLTGSLLNLAFFPMQLWQGWCAIQNASTEDASVGSDQFRPCVCDAGACTTPSSSLRRLTLMVSGDTMQGQFLLWGAPVGLGGPPQIRLRRVQ